MHYFFVRAKFSEIASQIRAEKKIDPDIFIGYIGLFRIVDFEIYDDLPFLNTRTHGNRKGFVLCPHTNRSFNLGIVINLDDDWKFISED